MSGLELAQGNTATVRFVPTGKPSLLDDAPGWNCEKHPIDESGNCDSSAGPICWKCHGTGTKSATATKTKSGKQNYTESHAINKVDQGSDNAALQPKALCPVCRGKGRLAPKRSDVEGITKPGVITRGRKRSAHWSPCGPAPMAMATRNASTKLVDQANSGIVDVIVPLEAAAHVIWLPRAGEELCNLVGSWRILQRVGSHRWTTDDLCTAYVATLLLQTLAAALADRSSPIAIRYLDLGTGNASVLQMVSWAILRDGRFKLSATGIEARKEAVQLARRSVAFNFGAAAVSTAPCEIVHGDFRDQVFTEKFDLITGTPPYFRVNFVVESTAGAVTSAVINQGGMPTAKQSAPARCEFRGGIEAYCEAAARSLNTSQGRFVVCENWLNHGRVVKAAENVGLQIIKRLDVEGREGRGTLFCVYIMIHKQTAEVFTFERHALAVRDAAGHWTESYNREVLATMSIPIPET